MNASVASIPPILWPLIALTGASLAYVKFTQSKLTYRVLWALAAFTAFIVGFMLV